MIAAALTLADWLSLSGAALTVGLLRALRPLSTRRKHERVLIRSVDVLTAIWATCATFLTLWYAFLPIGFAALSATPELDPIGVIALSAIIAHVGIERTLKTIRGTTN